MFRERSLRTARLELPPGASGPTGWAIRPNFIKSGVNLPYILDIKQPKGKNSSRNLLNTLATSRPTPYDVSLRILLTASRSCRGILAVYPNSLDAKLSRFVGWASLKPLQVQRRFDPKTAKW
jgi:hypothetical protein